MANSRYYFGLDDPRFTSRMRLVGVGKEERMPPGFVARRKGLPAYLLVVFHGEAEVELGGRRRTVGAGTAVLWDENRPHFFGCEDTGWSHSWVVFSGECWEADRLWMEPRFERPLAVGDGDFVARCFENLLREFEGFSKPDLPALAAGVTLLLREFCRGEEARRDSIAYPDPVDKAVRWIDANLSQSMAVGTVARRVGYSASRLQQLFRERLGCSVQRYVEGRRLQEARYWLMHSGLRIAEVAERVGFADAFYFSRRFRRAIGQSPMAFRRSHHRGGAKDYVIPKRN